MLFSKPVRRNSMCDTWAKPSNSRSQDPDLRRLRQLRASTGPAARASQSGQELPRIVDGIPLSDTYPSTSQPILPTREKYLCDTSRPIRLQALALLPCSSFPDRDWRIL